MCSNNDLSSCYSKNFGVRLVIKKNTGLIRRRVPKYLGTSLVTDLNDHRMIRDLKSVIIDMLYVLFMVNIVWNLGIQEILIHLPSFMHYLSAWCALKRPLLTPLKPCWGTIQGAYPGCTGIMGTGYIKGGWGGGATGGWG